MRSMRKLSWPAGTAADAFAQVRWQGMGNQYNIHGPCWIVLSASEGTPALSTAATDLQSWLQVAAGDRDPIQNKLEFLTDLKERKATGRPRRLQNPTPDRFSGSAWSRSVACRAMELPVTRSTVQDRQPTSLIPRKQSDRHLRDDMTSIDPGEIR